MERGSRQARKLGDTKASRYEYVSPSGRRPSRLVLIAGVGGLVLITATAVLLMSKPAMHTHSDEQTATGQAATAAGVPPATEDGQEDYLATNPFDAAKVLPPPPPDGSARAEADRKIFIATRRLQGTPRWALATSDDDQSVVATLADFGCALGIKLDASAAPQTQQLFERLAPGAQRALDGAKSAFGRKRPYLTEDGPICVAKTAELAASPDYPSGHATWGWMQALILSEIVPDRAS